MPRLHPEQDILTAIRPTLADERLVIKSAEQAERHGQTSATGNNEQKIGAHMLRLEKLFSREYKVAKKVWDMASDKLLISPEAIMGMDDGGEAFWHSQKQILRDTGHGGFDLDSESILRGYREAQRQSLLPWKGYLSGEGSGLPTWFKLYAWDGMSSMGLIDRKKKAFMKRSSVTVTPYPPFDEQALNMVYEAIQGQINAGEKLQPTSFNKLYAKALFEAKGVIPTPDDPDEIEGEWIEYGLENKKDMMGAATVTPWCISQEWAADYYLRECFSRFTFFHLRDKTTGELSPTACVSIRSDIHGNTVKEVSGLLEKQMLEPSLLGVVDAKLAQYDGTDEYRATLHRNNRLKALDRIYQDNRPFSLEELKEIEQLQADSSRFDIRTNDFSQSFWSNKEEYGASLGPEVKYLFQDYEYWKGIAHDRSALRQAIEIMGPEYVSKRPVYVMRNGDYRDGEVFLELVKAGLDISAAIEALPPAYRRELLLNTVDIYYLVLRSQEEQAAYLDAVKRFCKDTAILERSPLTNVEQARHVDSLKELGVQVDVNKVIEEIDAFTLTSTMQVAQLLRNDANPDVLFEKVRTNPRLACDNLEMFIDYGAHINPLEFSRSLNEDQVRRHKWDLIRGGVPRREIRQRLNIPWYKRLR